MADTVVLASWRLTIDRSNFNPLTNAPVCVEVAPGVFTQTWIYDLTQETPPPPGAGFSSLEFQLCPVEAGGPVTVTTTQPPGALPGLVQTNINAQQCLFYATFPAPTPVQRQVKFNVNPAGGTFLGQYTITVNGCYASTDIFAAIKTGGGPAGVDTCGIGMIIGPSCETLPPVPPVTRGIDISETKDFIEI